MDPLWPLIFAFHLAVGVGFATDVGERREKKGAVFITLQLPTVLPNLPLLLPWCQPP